MTAPSSDDKEEEALHLLERLKAWDMMDATADGPYWRGEIERVLRIPLTAPLPECGSMTLEKAIRADAMLALDSFGQRLAMHPGNIERLVGIMADILDRAFAARSTSGALPKPSLIVSQEQIYNVADAARSDVIEVLRELVACKDMHDRIENRGNGISDEEAKELNREYRRRRPLAWNAARKILTARGTLPK